MGKSLALLWGRGTALWDQGCIFHRDPAKMVPETPREMIVNSDNICYTTSSKSGTTKHLIMAENASSQKLRNKSQNFQSVTAPNQNIRKVWLSWSPVMSFCSDSDKPHSLRQASGHISTTVYASVPDGNKVALSLLLIHKKALNLWKDRR